MEELDLNKGNSDADLSPDAVEASAEEKAEASDAAATAAEEANAQPTQTVRRPVVYYPDPVLNKTAEPVVVGFDVDTGKYNIADESVYQLLADLKQTMLVGGGLGISAPQLGTSLRVFVTRMDCENSDDSFDQDVRVYINPTVTLGRKLKVKGEGCMSFPGLLIKTKRATSITVTAFDEAGREFHEELSGLQAHVVQHENNHLDGITLFERMNDAQKIKCRKGLKALRSFRRYHAQMALKATEAVSDDVIVTGTEHSVETIKGDCPCCDAGIPVKEVQFGQEQEDASDE